RRMMPIASGAQTAKHRIGIVVSRPTMPAPTLSSAPMSRATGATARIGPRRIMAASTITRISSGAERNAVWRGDMWSHRTRSPGFFTIPIVNLGLESCLMSDERMTRRASIVGLVIAVCLVAANMRPTITAVGPLLDQIGDDTGMATATLGFITAVPLLAWAVVSPLAHDLS